MTILDKKKEVVKALKLRKLRIIAKNKTLPLKEKKVILPKVYRLPKLTNLDLIE